MWLALGDPVVGSTARNRLQLDFKVCAVSVSPTPDYRGCWAGLEEGHKRFSQHFWKWPQGSHFPPPPAKDAISAGYGGSALGQTVCSTPDMHSTLFNPRVSSFCSFCGGESWQRKRPNTPKRGHRTNTYIRFSTNKKLPFSIRTSQYFMGFAYT